MGWFFFDSGLSPEYPLQHRYECVGGPLDGECRLVFVGDRLMWSNGPDPDVTHLHDMAQRLDGNEYLMHSRVLRDPNRLLE